MRYWFKNCPRCRQGRLFLMRLCETGALYLHCEECEWAWDDPALATDPTRGKLGIDLDGEYASAQQIGEMGWQAYADNTATD
jgi:hypothetical protein